MSYLKKMIPVNRISDVGLEYGYVITAGMPIGLLLALTYSESSSGIKTKNISPIGRIGESIIRSNIKKS